LGIGMDWIELNQRMDTIHYGGKELMVIGHPIPPIDHFLVDDWNGGMGFPH
jgi:hypothetical protein